MYEHWPVQCVDALGRSIDDDIHTDLVPEQGTSLILPIVSYRTACAALTSFALLRDCGYSWFERGCMGHGEVERISCRGRGWLRWLIGLTADAQWST